MHTIFVEDLDALVEQIARRGLHSVKRETYPNGVRKVTFRDPDGNEIGYGVDRRAEVERDIRTTQPIDQAARVIDRGISRRSLARQRHRAVDSHAGLGGDDHRC